jgi:hypothetical protein
MLDEMKSNYKILKTKYEAPAISTKYIIKGRPQAEMTVDRLNRNLTEEERSAGWSYILEMTNMKPSVIKKKAPTHKRAPGRKRSRWIGR